MSFATTFVNLLDRTTKPLDENYELQGNKYLPVVTIPSLENQPKYCYSGKVPQVGEVKTVKLKSIREPKFSLEYEVPVVSSVFSIKERLVSDPKHPLGDHGINENDIKLLLKGKVVNDTLQIADLESAQFTVMFHKAEQPEGILSVPIPEQIYWSEDQLPAKPKQSESTVKFTSDELPGVNDNFWKEIELVARRYIANPVELVEKLRSAYTFTSSSTNNMDLD